ncbi:flagellar biosynthesis anti-sigma factor FlgM [Roseateles violae]|uniref:Negative regulator of flagellin synthesis n=1 Tax=Roseateles violae TaxID=3058042 RepID=A0ABT8DPB2_9BURK|nr:flagellar biosynthesis anti-sigma factor FlgM [Pelomonas sp. PFR6]MDN3919818.1 flagellar biosynthesis anti-sigma factor FlgM [Pelomonas sp. PFR6]
MKIGNSPEAAASPVGADKAAAGTRSQQPAAAATVAGAKKAPEASTQLNLSSTASSLLSGVGADEGSFDAEKVQRISQAIAEGKFSVNADAIADKLIANAQELLARTQPKH